MLKSQVFVYSLAYIFFFLIPNLHRDILLKKLKMVAQSKKNGIIIMQLIYVTDEYPQFLYGYPGRHENSGQPLFLFISKFKTLDFFQECVRKYIILL